MQEYCLYLRKSRADFEAELHGEGETLLRHEKALLSLANKLKICVTKIYREVVSGETIAARPVMQQVLNEVEQGIWAGVLVMEVERLARGDTIDQGTVAQAFKYSHTKIITPAKTYNPNNEFDEEYFEFGLFMSRREYKTINRRIQRGRIASVKEGKYIGSTPPYGYNRIKIKNDKGYTLEPHPEQADVVKMVFEWYTRGEFLEDGTYKKLGTSLICKKLDSLRISPLKSKTWSRATIKDMLKNPVYIGKIRWQWRKDVKKSIDGQIVTIRPKQEEYILVDGLHEPIIDINTFNLAQKIMTGNRKLPIPASKELKNPLSGIVKCEKCGALMTRLAPNTRNKYSTLKCSNPYCDNVSTPIYVVENKIIDVLGDWMANYKLEYKTKKKHKPSNTIKILENSIAKLNEELKTLSLQFENTYNLLEQGIYTNDIFLERNRALNEQIGTIKQDIEKNQLELDKEKSREESKDIIVPRVKKVLDAYHTLSTAQDKNNMLKEVLEQVYYVKTVRNTKGKRENDNFTITILPKIPKA